jgi:hypothetical protein
MPSIKNFHDRGKCVDTAFMKKEEKSNDKPSGIPRQKEKFREIQRNSEKSRSYTRNYTITSI